MSERTIGCFAVHDNFPASWRIRMRWPTGRRLRPLEQRRRAMSIRHARRRPVGWLLCWRAIIERRPTSVWPHVCIVCRRLTPRHTLCATPTDEHGLRVAGRTQHG